MGKLEEALVAGLLQTSPAHKRDGLEQGIRKLLDARPLDQVIGLPTRRGKADGGIDGVLDITWRVNQQWVTATAALNIKVRKSYFSREQLGGFVLDMERQAIPVGIIIIASGLAPDALSELNRKNAQGQIRLVVLRLAEILAGEVDLPDMLVAGTELSTVLSRQLKMLLDAPL